MALSPSRTFPVVAGTSVTWTATATGGLDRSFGRAGAKKGYVVVENTAPGLAGEAWGVKVLANNAVVASAYRDGTYGTLNTGSGLVVKLTSAGDLDATFGKGGVFDLKTAGFGSSRFYSIADTGSGPFVVGGIMTTAANKFQALLVRLKANGQIDDAYGDEGVRFPMNGPAQTQIWAVAPGSSASTPLLPVTKTSPFSRSDARLSRAPLVGAKWRSAIRPIARRLYSSGQGVLLR